MATGTTVSLQTIYDDVESLTARVTTLEEQMRNVLDGVGNNGPIALTEGADLHELAIGDYYIPSATICATLLNKPTTGNSTAFVKVVPAGSEGQKMMYYYICSKDGASYYQAAYYTSGWGAWHEINVYDSGWQDLTLATGITPYSDAQKPRYRRIGKEVILCGVLKGVSGSDVTVATLPSNCRPTKKHIIPIACVGQMIGKISVETNGNVILNRTTVEPVIVENWHSIACSFCVD